MRLISINSLHTPLPFTFTLTSALVLRKSWIYCLRCAIHHINCSISKIFTYVMASVVAAAGRMTPHRLRMRWSRDDVIVKLRYPAKLDRRAFIRQSASATGRWRQRPGSERNRDAGSSKHPEGLCIAQCAARTVAGLALDQIPQVGSVQGWKNVGFRKKFLGSHVSKVFRFIKVCKKFF